MNGAEASRSQISLITVVALSLVCSLSLAQTREVLYGPETFVRDRGRPVTEVREFSIDGFEGPFTFHLRNGDENGDQRVSAAWVYLNGDLILGPSDFNQQVEGYEFLVTLTDPSSFQVELVSGPGDMVTVWIEGVRSSYSFEVGPAGGVIEFPNGVSLDFPLGALTEMTEIGLAELSCETVEPLVMAQDAPFGLPEKRCLRAVTLWPAGLNLNQHVLVKMPVIPLEAGAVMMVLDLDVQGGTYQVVDTPVHASAGSTLVEFWLDHFSNKAVFSPDSCLSETCRRCRFCENFDWVFCDLDPQMLPCCQMLFSEREECELVPSCATPEACCKQWNAHFRSEQDDNTSSNDCLIVSVLNESIYEECKDQNGDPLTDCDATYGFDSDVCDPEMVLIMEIEEDPFVYICDQKKIRSTLYGAIPSNPTIKIDPQIDPSADWHSEDEEIAEFHGCEGMVEGKIPGSVPIQAQAVGDRLNSLWGLLEVRKYPKLQLQTTNPFAANPESRTILPGQRLNVDMNVEGLCDSIASCDSLTADCGDDSCRRVRWTISGNVEFDSSTGTLVGLCPGPAGVEVDFRFCNQEFASTIDDISVGQLSSLAVTAPETLDGTPEAPAIDVGQTVQLVASIPGVCGVGESLSCSNLVENCPSGANCSLTWTAAEYAVELDEQNGIVTVTGKSSNTELVQATLVYCDRTLIDRINVTVKQPLEIHVRAKFGCCDWNASYCYIGEMQSSPVVPLTIEAWLVTSSGEVRNPPGGIAINAKPYLGKQHIQPGEDSCSQFSFHSGFGCSGLTDSDGAIGMEVFVPDDWYRRVPYVDAQVTASASGLSAETRIFGFTDDICFEHPHSDIVSSNQGFGGQVDDPSVYSRCEGTPTVSLSPSAGVFAAAASCTASSFCTPPNPCMDHLGGHQTGFWYDTIAIIPEDLNILADGMASSSVWVLFGTTLTCSGDVDISGGQSAEANASLLTYYQEPNRCDASSGAVSQQGWAERHVSLYEPYWAFEQGGMYVGCGVDPCWDGVTSEFASATLTATSSWDEVTEVAVYDYVSGDYVPIEFYVFSCSGRFTRGDLQASCQE